jgi:DNA-binding response OmpR family regulator
MIKRVSENDPFRIFFTKKGGITLLECQSEKSQKKYKILIVDDEPAVRMTVGEMLKPLNCKIFHANNANEALNTVKSVDFDLIILDVLLPGRHGFYVCSSIREMENKRNVPILIMTAVYTKMKYYYQAKECGADAYVIKPFKMDTLINKVTKLLKIEATH